VKTVIIGGTYNPIHIGHLYLAEEVQKSCGYERVILVPAHVPAHKETDEAVTPQQRLEMLRCAIQGSDFVIDGCEIRRGGVSYSIDTVDEIEKNYEVTGKLGLVIGDDLVAGLHEWKEWETLVERVDLIIAHRSYEERIPCSVEHSYIDNLVLPISSTDIRERIRGGRAYRYLLPDAVYSYIIENGIYQERK
jgi:nicotinate-nucleotide adenylyltransferase